MLTWTFNFLFFAMLLAGIGGFALNSGETGLLDLYVRVVAGRGVIPAVENSKQTVKSNQESVKQASINSRTQQDRIRDRMRDLQAKIFGIRHADKARRRNADHSLSTLNQRNDENIRRQKDRIRDLQQIGMSRNRMSSLRNQR